MRVMIGANNVFFGSKFLTCGVIGWFWGVNVCIGGSCWVVRNVGVFGFGCGLITFLIRRFGSYPEGVMFSILVMNAIAPFLNNITYRKYGYGKKGNLKVQEKNQKWT